jgi:uncharacterized cofD-like protein
VARLRSILADIPSLLRWLVPGIGVKRWMGLFLLGGTLLGLGLGILLLEIDQVRPLPALAGGFTLQFLPPLARAALFFMVGLVLMLVALAQFNRTLLAPFIQPGQNVVSAVSEHRRKGRGPKIVAIGGGTGLSILLRGLKQYTANLTAIVTVADDGGSSGRLRRALGVLPPGDFRNCIAALADDESLITMLFQYRFGQSDETLGGHSFGNLFITAMAEVTGSFEQALIESAKVLAIRGQVIPSTLSNVTLVGELVDEAAQVSWVEGESHITASCGAIRRVYLQPEAVPAYPGAIRALLEADLIVFGPGSLYTSVMPNLLVPDLTEAISASRAQKVYVCNTATQPGETDGYSVMDHVTAIERHTRPGLFSLVAANSNQQGQLLPKLAWVTLDFPPAGHPLTVVSSDLTDEVRPWRHDANKLADLLIKLIVYTQAAADETATP